MFKDDLNEYKGIQHKETQKYSEITKKVHSIVESTLKKYSVQLMHTEEISARDLWIKVKISGISIYSIPNDVVTDITKEMGAEKSSMTIKEDKLELTFNY